MSKQKNESSEEIHKYYEIVMNYVKNGTLPDSMKKEDLIDRIASLNEGPEKSCLKVRVESLLTRMPSDPVYKNCPPQLKKRFTAKQWSVLAVNVAIGIAVSAIEYQVSEDPYSTAIYGLLASSAVFFVQRNKGYYKPTRDYNEVDKMFNERMQRANPFLDRLGSNIREMTDNGLITVKPVVLQKG